MAWNYNRCPDCGHDFPVKPEVVIQKESCKCGRTEATRIARYVLIGIILISMMCFVDSLYSSYVLSQAIADQSIKVEIMNYDANGRPLKKLTR